MTSSDYIMILSINNSAQAVLLQVTGLAVPPLQTTQCGVVRKSVHLFSCVCGCGKHVVGQRKTLNTHGMKFRTESKTRVNPENKAGDN